eukprot:1880617-Prorocentrum_lima.AAC.1
MTSSLVGSEMCIRDREEEKRLASSSASAETGGSLTSGSAAGLGPQSVAVSYTHLTLPTICSV